MPDLKIHRSHSLGFERAREVAWKWAEEAERKFDMSCTVIEGDFSDTVEFTRTGVSGTLVVAADHFELKARLGFLLGAFSQTIETEIQKTLDALLAAAPAPAPARVTKATKATRATVAGNAAKAGKGPPRGA